MVTATQVEPSHQMGRGLGLSFPYATGQKPRRGGRWDEGHEKPSMRWGIRFPKLPPPKTNMTMETQPFEDAFPIENRDIPMSC